MSWPAELVKHSNLPQQFLELPHLKNQAPEPRALAWKPSSILTMAESRMPAGFPQTAALRLLKASLVAAAAAAEQFASRSMNAAGLFCVFSLFGQILLAQSPSSAAGPGNYVREITAEGAVRSCLIHVPAGREPAKPVPLVLAIHGAAMNGAMMQRFSGMDRQADEAGFIVAYPNGTGLGSTLLTWNSGGLGIVREKPDDVTFFHVLLDELIPQFNIDSRRIYAAGMSNGGMMAYRLAAEMPHRIAAVAAVAGTLALPDPRPSRPVPLIHFHGTADRIVPYQGPPGTPGRGVSFRSVPDSILTWVKLTGCPVDPVTRKVPDQFDDGTEVKVTTYGPGPKGAAVVLVDIIGGGHTWPGHQPALSIIGRSTREIDANTMMWEFFKKHPLPPSKPTKKPQAR